MSLYNYEEKLWPFMVKKMFIEIRLIRPNEIRYNPVTYILKGMSKSLK